MTKKIHFWMRGFTLIEVITTLVVISFAGLMVATVLGAGYLRVEQIVTQQEDVRQLASCIERMKAEFAGRTRTDIDSNLDAVREACGAGIDVRVQRVKAVVNTSSSSANYKRTILEACEGDVCPLRFVTVSKNAQEFSYVFER